MVNPLASSFGCSRSTRRNRRGIAAVEFAVVAPIFFVMLFGVIDLSRGFMVQSEFDEVARIGCRTAILQGKTNSDVTTAMSSSLSSFDITGTTTTIYVNGSVGDITSAKTGDAIQVSVSVSAARMSWIPGLSFLCNNISSSSVLPKP